MEASLKKNAALVSTFSPATSFTYWQLIAISDWHLKTFQSSGLSEHIADSRSAAEGSVSSSLEKGPLTAVLVKSLLKASSWPPPHPLAPPAPWPHVWEATHLFECSEMDLTNCTKWRSLLPSPPPSLGWYSIPAPSLQAREPPDLFRAREPPHTQHTSHPPGSPLPTKAQHHAADQAPPHPTTGRAPPPLQRARGSALTGPPQTPVHPPAGRGQHRRHRARSRAHYNSHQPLLCRPMAPNCRRRAERWEIDSPRGAILGSLRESEREGMEAVRCAALCSGSQCGVWGLCCKLWAEVFFPDAPRRFGAELTAVVMHLKKRRCLHNNGIVHILKFWIKVLPWVLMIHIKLSLLDSWDSPLCCQGSTGEGKGKETALRSTVSPSLSHAGTVWSSGSSGAICPIPKCHFLSQTPQLGLLQPAGCFAVYLFILSAS